MEKIITYKQILKRSFILGVTFFACTVLIMVVGMLFRKAHIHLTGPFLDIIIFSIFNGCSCCLLFIYAFIGGPPYLVVTLVFSPIIIYLLLGNALFLLLKKYKWLTLRKFTVILLVVYVFVNTTCGIIFFIWLSSDCLPRMN